MISSGSSLSLHPFSHWTLPELPKKQPITESDEGGITHHPLFGNIFCDDDHAMTNNEEYTRAQAQKAHDLLKSIRRRHVQLEQYLKSFNMYRANPLGGAMCAEVEDKIHQMALLIRTQQNQVRHIVDEYDQCLASPSSFASSRSDSLDGLLAWDEPQVIRPAVVPATDNWLAANRVAILKEVVDFSQGGIVRVEHSALLSKYPPNAAKRPTAVAPLSIA